METVKKISILCSILFVFSCSKEEQPTTIKYEEENFLTGYLQQTGFDNFTSTTIDRQENCEFCTAFTPLVKGVITALQVKLPASNPSLRITIWDAATKIAIKTVIVNVAQANTAYTFDIEDFQLQKDKDYAISFNSNDYFVRRWPSDDEANYPITVKNIKINSFSYDEGLNQTYPSVILKRSYLGDLSFNFLQTQ